MYFKTCTSYTLHVAYLDTWSHSAETQIGMRTEKIQLSSHTMTYDSCSCEAFVHIHRCLFVLTIEKKESGYEQSETMNTDYGTHSTREGTKMMQSAVFRCAMMFQ